VNGDAAQPQQQDQPQQPQQQQQQPQQQQQQAQQQDSDLVLDALLASDGGEEEAHGTQDGDGRNRVFTAEEVEAIIKKRLARQRQKLVQELKSQVQQELLVERAKQQGDLKAAIEALERELNELRPSRERLRQFEELAEARYQALLKELPEPIRLLAPDDDTPVLEKERWLVTKALPAAQKLKSRNGAATPAPGNNPADPQPSTAKKDDVVQDIIRSYQANPLFRPLI
jgi:hypothetical protein